MMSDNEVTSTQHTAPTTVTQRGTQSAKGDDHSEDVLQFDLDVNDALPDNNEDKPKDDTPATKEQAAASSGATTSLPWLEQRARFYPAPILPNKPTKQSTVSKYTIIHVHTL